MMADASPFFFNLSSIVFAYATSYSVRTLNWTYFARHLNLLE
jgi:hypothetical protein